MISGAITWHFFPSIALNIGTAQLLNPKGYPDKIFARIDSASVSVQVWSLLWGHIEVGSVALNGFRLYLTQLDARRNNWTFTPPKGIASTPHVTPPKHEQSDEHEISKATPQQASKPIPFSIRRVRVNHAYVSYTNLATHQHYVLKQVRSYDNFWCMTV